VGVVVVAAGMGVRLGAGMPKALVRIGGRTLVEHAVARARGSSAHLVVVAPSTQLAHFEELLPGIPVVAGGAERIDSVAAGLAALPSEVDVVLVHDAARALAPASLFAAVAAAVAEGADGVVPGLPVTDTVKQVDAASRVVATPERSALRAVQTPQGFRRSALEAAHAGGGDATDDAMLIERAGGVVQVIDGDPLAMKVTLPSDIEAAERLLAEEPVARPVLVILGGLPGVGKTTLARALAGRIPMAHIRVDTIEGTLVHCGMADSITGPEGYAVAFRVAGDQLALGLSVVADTVNPMPETRAWWRQVATQHGARVVEVELECSDRELHEQRVVERPSDVPGMTVPTWDQVLDRDYHAWSPNLLLDSALHDPAELADSVIDWLRSHQ
jgi:2-C-methyl-D-erythritol 4-phosphate cytidylyltransferase